LSCNKTRHTFSWRQIWSWHWSTQGLNSPSKNWSCWHITWYNTRCNYIITQKCYNWNWHQVCKWNCIFGYNIQTHKNWNCRNALKPESKYNNCGIKACSWHLQNKRPHSTHCAWWWSIASLQNGLPNFGVVVNVTLRDEHVPEIERHIRTIKERTRETYATLPFQALLLRLVIKMVYVSVFWLNAFPVSSGISKTISPRKFITWDNIDYKKHCCLDFGSYVQTHECHDNSMLPRTIGAIALRPAGNNQGGH